MTAGWIDMCTFVYHRRVASITLSEHHHRPSFFVEASTNRNLSGKKPASFCLPVYPTRKWTQFHFHLCVLNCEFITLNWTSSISSISSSSIEVSLFEMDEQERWNQFISCATRWLVRAQQQVVFIWDWNWVWVGVGVGDLDWDWNANGNTNGNGNGNAYIIIIMLISNCERPCLLPSQQRAAKIHQTLDK